MRWVPQARELASLIALSVMLAACSSETTSPGAGGSGAGGSAGSVGTGGSAGAGTGGTSACASGSSICKQDPCCNCGAAKCSAEVDACLCNGDCASALICATACKTAVCVGQCAGEHPDGGVEFTALRNCTKTACASECPL